jgi:spermidine dehydrogenase
MKKTRPGGQGRDRQLGMHRQIDRRDFLQGAAITIMAAAGGVAPELVAAAELAAQDRPGYYPPTRTGMRGSHPGSFENAHALRDNPHVVLDAEHTGERYDLVVVGGGISGLSAAHFYRGRAGRDAKILIIDNHDDFGGHAKRNEFHVDGKLLIMNGGTAGISSPKPYSAVADGLLKTLGVHPEKLAESSYDRGLYDEYGLGSATFFDEETFGTDKLVRGGNSGSASAEDMAKFVAEAPLSEAVRKDVLAIETGDVDYLPGLSADEKKDRLSRMSYADYLLQVVKADPGVIPYYLHRSDGLWGCGIDGVSALDCWGVGFPGFRGLKLPHTPTARMGYTPRLEVATGGSYQFAFPDGNATVARLLVRDLVPAAVPGSTVEDAVTARTDYSKLDVDGQPVRIRLSCTGAHVANRPGGGVRMVYLRGDKAYAVTARHCVLACWNMMIPFICPELPDAQKAALHYLVKTPLVYTSVALSNWRAFAKLQVSRINCPGGYHSSISLDSVMAIGKYSSARDPGEPVMVHMLRTPAQPGLNEREQHIAGRNELLRTPFSTFERNIRDQLNRVLRGGGFDAARDIAGIAVNRWAHGYAPEYNPLVDPEEGLPIEAARARAGAIAIANADSGGGAYTDVAIDQAHRAVSELLG